MFCAETNELKVRSLLMANQEDVRLFHITVSYNIERGHFLLQCISWQTHFPVIYPLFYVHITLFLLPPTYTRAVYSK